MLIRKIVYHNFNCLGEIKTKRNRLQEYKSGKNGTKRTLFIILVKLLFITSKKPSKKPSRYIFTKLVVFVGLENLSYKKNTWQHTTRPEGYSSRAVDGLFTNRAFDGNQCASTGDSYFALWWVDLGHISRIDHIVVYFRTDNVPCGKINDVCTSLRREC